MCKASALVSFLSKTAMVYPENNSLPIINTPIINAKNYAGIIGLGLRIYEHQCQ